MSYQITSENDILNQAVRAKIIEDIEGFENRCRKDRAYLRQECYRDQTIRYVVATLLNQFDVQTVKEMRYSLSNISIVRKIVDKLARVYSNGVQREITGDVASTEKLHKLEKLLKFNSAMKTTNRFLKLQKNLDFYVKPCPVESRNGKKWTIKLEPLVPYHYDVCEDQYDRTRALVHVLSDYTPPANPLADIDPAYHSGGVMSSVGDGVDQSIADTPEDTNVDLSKQYIFWTESYHFTTDNKGRIIENATNVENKNPFNTPVMISFAIDQDGYFWAKGGDDLVDGGILLNSMISHNNHVGVVQGYGQFYMIGENLPRSIKVGPTKAILAEYKKDEQAEPKMGFLSANPQLDSLRGLVESYLALLLTTNNLSTSGVAANLGQGASMPSGIALIIDKSESLEDVNDQRQVFLDQEPKIWLAINAMLKAYGSELIPELQGLELPEGFEKNLSIKFNDPQPIMSEAEKLANLKLRKDLGLETMISMLMKDDPTLTEKMAEEKLLKILEQKIKEKSLGAVEEPEPQPVPPQNPQEIEKEDEKEVESEDEGELDESNEDDN